MPGDMIALKRVEDWQTYLPSGTICIISTNEFKVLRKIIPNTGKNKMINTAWMNKDNNVMEEQIPISIINNIYKVVGIFRKV